jgi:ribonuclease P protein component
LIQTSKNTPVKNTLGKAYKLCHQRVIESLYENDAQKNKQYPFAIQFKIIELSSNTPFQIVLSAPKRRFRDANQRNRIKRLMRECVRLQKHDLENYLIQNNKQLALFMVYIDQQEQSIEFLEKKTKQLFSKIITQLHETI